MILLEVTFIPVGVGISGSEYVKLALESFKEDRVKFYPNSMGTVLEDVSLDKLFSSVSKAEKKIMEHGVKRLETAIKIDHRVDLENTVQRKLDSIGAGQ